MPSARHIEVSRLEGQRPGSPAYRLARVHDDPVHKVARRDALLCAPDRHGLEPGDRPGYLGAAPQGARLRYVSHSASLGENLTWLRTTAGVALLRNSIAESTPVRSDPA